MANDGIGYSSDICICGERLGSIGCMSMRVVPYAAAM